MSSIKRQIKIRRSDSGVPVVVQVPVGSNPKESMESQNLNDVPFNLKALLDKAVGLDVPIDPPSPKSVLPSTMMPLYDKQLIPLPTKPKVTMENLKDWVEEMEAMPGPNQGETRSTERLKKRFLPMITPNPFKLPDIENGIKHIEIKSPEKTLFSGTPKVVKIVKLEKGGNPDGTTKPVIKIVKPIKTNDTVQKPVIPVSIDPPPLKDENHRKFRYCCLKCQKRFIRINGAQLPDGKLREFWFSRLGLNKNKRRPKVETTSKYALICSEHFDEKDVFVKDGEKRVVPGALPKCVKTKYPVADKKKKYPRLGCIKCKKRFDLVNGGNFPKTDAEVARWKKLLVLDEKVKVNFKNVVCSDHFDEKDLFISRNGELRTVSNASPMDHRDKDAIQRKKNTVIKNIIKNTEVPVGQVKLSLKELVEKEKWKNIKSIRPFFRPLPTYKAIGEQDNEIIDNEEPGPSIRSNVIKEELPSDHEDEKERMERNKEVKIVKKGCRKEKKQDMVEIKIKEEPKEEVEEPIAVKIKEEPMDIDERVDESFIIEPSDDYKNDSMEIKNEFEDPAFEFLNPPETSDGEEPVLLSISRDDGEEEDDEEDNDTDRERFQSLAMSLFSTNPQSMPSTSMGSSLASYKVFFPAPLSNDIFKQAIIEQLPERLKKQTEKNENVRINKFAGITTSQKGPDYYYCTVCGVDTKFHWSMVLKSAHTHVKSQKHKQLLRLYSKLYIVMKCTQNFRGIEPSARSSDKVFCSYCREQVYVGDEQTERELNLLKHVMTRQHFESYMRASKIAKKKALQWGLNVEIKEKTNKKKKEKGINDGVFKPEYSEIYEGIVPSSKGEHYCFCKMCKIDLSLERLGEHAIYVHIKKSRHQRALDIHKKNIVWLNRGNSTNGNLMEI